MSETSDYLKRPDDVVKVVRVLNGEDAATRVAERLGDGDLLPANYFEVVVEAIDDLPVNEKLDCKHKDTSDVPTRSRVRFCDE